MSKSIPTRARLTCPEINDIMRKPSIYSEDRKKLVKHIKFMEHLLVAVKEELQRLIEEEAGADL